MVVVELNGFGYAASKLNDNGWTTGSDGAVRASEQS